MPRDGHAAAGRTRTQHIYFLPHVGAIADSSFVASHCHRIRPHILSISYTGCAPYFGAIILYFLHMHHMSLTSLQRGA